MLPFKEQDLAKGIVQACHAQFEQLPKHGKPTKRSNGQLEWTILAGIVLATPHPHTLDETQQTWDLECISLATGSKCLPQGKQSPRGDLLNDCHAEVLARRGFNKWCLLQLLESIKKPENPKNIFRYVGTELEHGSQKPLFELVHPAAKFHLYVSQAPCGDATTASLALVQTEESKKAFLSGQTQRGPGKTEPLETGSKRPLDTTHDSATERRTLKQHKMDQGTFALNDRLPGNDPSGDFSRALQFRRGRLDYDSVGVLRTKPGRVDSEPTLSMSCSDKIARWDILGITSALVLPFLDPIYLSSVTSKELFDKPSLERAFYKRIQECGYRPLEGHAWTLDRMTVQPTETPFEHSKESVNAKCQKEGISASPVASAMSISWIAYPANYTTEDTRVEVLVNGCKSGASTKKQLQPKSRSRLCKVNMFQSAVELWKALPEARHCPLVQQMLTGSEGEISISYHRWKGLDARSKEARDHLFQGVFRHWMQGQPELELFNLHGDPSSEPIAP